MTKDDTNPAVKNHSELFTEIARLAGTVVDDGGLVYTNCGPERHAQVVFPSDSVTDKQLDKMMDYYLQELPRTVGVWKEETTGNDRLSARLVARGFQLGWEPQWMVLDLKTAELKPKKIKGVSIQADKRAQVPLSVPLSNLQDDSIYATEMRTDGTITKFTAKMGATIVGHADIFFGAAGAGIHNVGVHPDYNGNGIGTELVKATCALAQKRGYAEVSLNATGREMYERVGFKHVGNGSTWWLYRDEYEKVVNSRAQQKIIQHICLGQVDELAKLPQDTSVDFATTAGLSLVQMATHFKQTAVSNWLIARGSKHTVLDLWDIGGKTRANSLLPAHVNDLIDGKTALHHAVERDDAAFAEYLLKFNPSLEIRDSGFSCTALGWCSVLERTEIGTMIREAAEQMEASEFSTMVASSTK